MTDTTYRIGFDIGGTFTDFALLDGGTGALRFHKVLTTPASPAQGALDGLQAFLGQEGIAAGDVTHMVHGTTLVANVLIERKGATVGLLATGGFRDILEMRTEQRYDIYDLFLRYPEPLAPRRLRKGIAERTDRDGRVLIAPDPAEVRAVVEELRAGGAQALAICFLHAFRNPANERAVRDVIREVWPEVAVSISSEVAPQIREYERTSTTVANAYVQPLLQDYLDTIDRTLATLGFAGAFYPMLSSGGTASVRTATRIPIQLVESGPAAGATAAAFFGGLNGREELISFDMGGTTAKICLIEDGRPTVAPNLEVARVDRFMKGSGIPLQLPTVEMLEIGAGGGSVAWIDSLELMRVGPRSAGADPGPACYGRGGTEPTVTDADLLLGYLDPGFFLGGQMSLDLAAAERAVGGLGGRLGLSPVRTAWAIHQLVNEHMAAAARIHVIERAKDPRRYALLAFGGGGPVHAAGVAKALNVRQVLCPPGAGVASAIGLLVAPASLELARSYPVLMERLDWEEIRGLYRELEERAIEQLGEVGVARDEVTFERAVDGRFAGQLHEIEIPLPVSVMAGGGGAGDGASGGSATAGDSTSGSGGTASGGANGAVDEMTASFFARYEELYKHLPRAMAIELLSWRLTARGPASTVTIPKGEDDAADASAALKGTRRAYFGDATGEASGDGGDAVNSDAASGDGDFVDAPVYDRYALRPGMRFAGPAIVEERESTIVVRPGMSVEVDAYLNVVLTI